jgi:hypothetical protein
MDKSSWILLGLSPTFVGRNVPAKEKSRMLEEPGKLYVEAGVKPRAELARKISR